MRVRRKTKKSTPKTTHVNNLATKLFLCQIDLQNNMILKITQNMACQVYLKDQGYSKGFVVAGC
jgi:hypothetical protein